MIDKIKIIIISIFISLIPISSAEDIEIDGKTYHNIWIKKITTVGVRFKCDEDPSKFIGRSSIDKKTREFLEKTYHDQRKKAKEVAEVQLAKYRENEERVQKARMQYEYEQKQKEIELKKKQVEEEKQKLKTKEYMFQFFVAEYIKENKIDITYSMSIRESVDYDGLKIKKLVGYLMNVGDKKRDNIKIVSSFYHGKTLLGCSSQYLDIDNLVPRLAIPLEIPIERDNYITDSISLIVTSNGNPLKTESMNHISEVFENEVYQKVIDKLDDKKK